MPNDSGTSDVGLSAPPELLASRMIDPDALSVDVRIGDTVVQMERVGTQWRGLFSLPEGVDNATLVIVWYLDTGGLRMPIAAVEPMEINTDTNREIHVAEYRFMQFDNDQDGVNNFDEINAGTDPLVANMLAGQPGRAQLQVLIRDAASNDVKHPFSSTDSVILPNGSYILEVMSDFPVARLRMEVENDECGITQPADIVSNNADDATSVLDDNVADRFRWAMFNLIAVNVTCQLRFNVWQENFVWAGNFFIAIKFEYNQN